MTLFMPNAYAPKPEHKFSFGLWTVSNRGRDPFGDVVRPPLSPNDAAAMLGEVGAWGVNLHDNDLVPIDATPAERDQIVKEFQAACKSAGIVVPMATVNLFYDPVFRDGAFTANDPRVRAYAVQKTLRAMDLGAELGAKIFVLWGGREGTETDACRRPDEAVKRLRDAVDYLCEYSIDKKYGYRFAMESKPNEPRGDIYMASTGAYLGFIPTLAHPELVGVNPEVAHEHMAGLNFLHAVGQETVIFEAPQRAQQAWLLRRVGPNVNLGNIATDDVIALETLRRAAATAKDATAARPPPGGRLRRDRTGCARSSSG